MARKRDWDEPRVVHRIARCGLRVTRSVLRRYSDAWFAAAKRRSKGNRGVRFPRHRRGLVPVRWYHGKFALDGRVLTIPVVREDPR